MTVGLHTDAREPDAFSASDAESERYSRQVLFAGIGEQGQRRLLASHVGVVGCGATGAAVAGMLARAGVGCLTIIDRDYVEWSNLQRQVLFEEQDAAEGLPKAEAARLRILAFNSKTQVHARIADLVPGNIHTLLADAQIVLDATDNFETRYLLNDYAVEQNKPWIYAGAVGSSAVTMNILPRQTACLACIFPEQPTGSVETCDTSGILNPAPNLAASLQAAEAMKWLTGAYGAMRRSLLSWDVWANQRAEVNASRPRAGCEVCDMRRFFHLESKGRAQITLCGRNSVQIHEHRRTVDFAELERRLQPHGQVRRNALLLHFQRGIHRMTIFSDGRAIVQGTTDVGLARSLYSRFIGS
ncbi:MAG TPA: ThiF family adenylyltransferase [Acidobacteriaceae bacterium]|nr:ThiF family adenylyltransferase [Acidobacteriaceae bacterium]